MNFKLITAPAVPVITLARAKLQCKITSNDRDDDINDAVAGARDFVESYLGVPVGEQVRRYTFDCWPGSYEFDFDVTELQAVTAAGVAVLPLPTLGGAQDRTLTLTASAPVVVTVKCGYVVANLPGVVKSAMLLMIADLVRNPQAQSEIELYKNHAVENLLWPHRVRLPI